MFLQGSWLGIYVVTIIFDWLTFLYKLEKCPPVCFELDLITNENSFKNTEFSLIAFLNCLYLCWLLDKFNRSMNQLNYKFFFHPIIWITYITLLKVQTNHKSGSRSFWPPKKCFLFFKLPQILPNRRPGERPRTGTICCIHYWVGIPLGPPKTGVTNLFRAEGYFIGTNS